MALRGILAFRREEDIKKIDFLDMLQYENAKSIVRLENEVKYLRDQNQLLLIKVIGKENKIRKIEAQEPIPGYQTLRVRIADKERESRLAYEKEIEKDIEERG